MLIFERFEGDIAVIENGEDRLEVPARLICGDIKEGDVLMEKDGMYIPDKQETLKRREKLLKLQNSLWS